ncbi:U32 family peptidase [Blautia pseudococcoides]|nr:U32 family peptidase [Blautia pseudococcoides]
MKYFSVPADFKDESIDKLAYLNSQYKDSKVIEVYGQKTEGNIINSGRMVDTLPQITDEQFYSYIRKANEKGINFNYTLNPSCFGNLEFREQGIQEIRSLITQLEERGVHCLTLSSPAIMELCKKFNPHVKIKASAICEINSPMKSLFYKELGVKRIVLDPDITRDFGKIKNICRVMGDGVEVIINNVCLRNCAYKMFHYNHEAHCSRGEMQEVRDFFTNRCSMQKAKRVENVMKLNWIRPEDLKFYEACGIKYFKIQGRQNVLEGDLFKVLEAYFEQNYTGNLYDLITLFAPYNSFQCYIDNKKLDGFLDVFYENEKFCTEKCDSCNYCRKFSEKCIDIETAENLNESAKKFFGSIDTYKKIKKPSAHDLMNLQNMEFNFDIQE